MSEGGGTGITTVAVLQSLAQARDRWGHEQAQAIWDSATSKIILGGSSNANDLRDLAQLIGERETPRSLDHASSWRWKERHRVHSSTIHPGPERHPAHQGRSRPVDAARGEADHVDPATVDGSERTPRNSSFKATERGGVAAHRSALPFAVVVERT